MMTMLVATLVLLPAAIRMTSVRIPNGLCYCDRRGLISDSARSIVLLPSFRYGSA